VRCNEPPCEYTSHHWGRTSHHWTARVDGARHLRQALPLRALPQNGRGADVEVAYMCEHL
jgi:hypothetical protein